MGHMPDLSGGGVCVMGGQTPLPRPFSLGPPPPGSTIPISQGLFRVSVRWSTRTLNPNVNPNPDPNPSLNPKPKTLSLNGTTAYRWSYGLWVPC